MAVAAMLYNRVMRKRMMKVRAAPMLSLSVSMSLLHGQSVCMRHSVKRKSYHSVVLTVLFWLTTQYKFAVRFELRTYISNTS